MVEKWLAIILSLLILTTSGCKGRQDNKNVEEPSIALPDTLRVVTLYSPTSYFTYRDEEMGFDYSLVKQFADEKSMILDLKVAPSMSRMIEMLDSGEVDMIAYEIPVTSEFKQKVIHAGPHGMTTQVLVQPRNSGGELITDVTQLVGKDVYVEKDSKYQHRLENLNEELGGGINIHIVDRDTLITEDLIEMVSKGEIPLTIVDSDIAKINKTYYRDLDITMELSFPQRASWGVDPRKPWLADSIDSWMDIERRRGDMDVLLKQYFELSKKEDSGLGINVVNGRVSPYDNLFKKYASQIGWDWRLLAAQGYVESRFRPNAVSWAGARGVMQIMPKTAAGLGLSMSRIFDPESNIATAVKLIGKLDKMLQSRIPDDEERKKFILASYNGGQAHVFDAIALAKKTGRNPEVWKGNVSDALMLKSNPKYFNDPVVKYGYFRGRETTAYVRDIYKVYERLKREVSA